MRIRQLVCVLAAWPLCAALSGDLETARAALQDKLYPIAQTHAEKALRSRSADATQSLLVLLEALHGQGQFKAMLSLFDTFGDVVRQSSQPETFRYWKALALLNAGQPAEAIRLTEAATNMPPAYADAMRRIGARAKQASGDLPGALALFAEVDKRSTNLLIRAANALEWAMALDQSGRSDAALEVLKIQAELSVAGESVSDGALLRGRILMRQGKTAEATMVFNQIAMSERVAEAARVQALVEMSVFTLNGGKTNEAVAYARSAYERAQLPETRRLAGFRLGDLLAANAATIDEGEGLIKALVREFPEHVASMQAQLKLADSLLQAKRPERAAAEYRIFLETYPSTSLDATVLQGRGWALMQLGRFTEAGGSFQRAAEVSADVSMKAECLYKQGDALLADARFSEASQVYAKLAEAYPQTVHADRALFQSADCLERAGKRAEAAAQYRKVAEKFPDRDVAPKALLRLAAVLSEVGNFDEAVRTYTSVLGVFNQKGVRVDAFMGRGKVYYRTYRFDAAMQDFASVAESDPTRRDEARFLLTLCLYGLGRDKEARAAAAAFLLDFPESSRLPDMMLWLGKFDFNRGKFEDARRFFLEYVARWPSNRWADAALLWSARAASGGADFTGAVELVTRLVRAYPQSTRVSEALLVQADALMELARFDEAVLLLDQVISQAPDSEWSKMALMRKGDCLFALGADNGTRYQEALVAYRAMLEKGSLTPALTLNLQFKAGRCLEKMKRIDDAIDQYYSEVMIRYQNERAGGAWYDETSTSLFVRAAFNVAELYEQKGEPEQAVRILQRVVQAGVPGEEEARQRIERLRKKKAGV
jgi:tetratricopeptide (TPR) repeat protein